MNSNLNVVYIAKGHYNEALLLTTLISLWTARKHFPKSTKFYLYSDREAINSIGNLAICWDDVKVVDWFTPNRHYYHTLLDVLHHVSFNKIFYINGRINFHSFPLDFDCRRFGVFMEYPSNVDLRTVLDEDKEWHLSYFQTQEKYHEILNLPLGDSETTYATGILYIPTLRAARHIEILWKFLFSEIKDRLPEISSEKLDVNYHVLYERGMNYLLDSFLSPIQFFDKYSEYDGFRDPGNLEEMNGRYARLLDLVSGNPTVLGMVENRKEFSVRREYKHII